MANRNGQGPSEQGPKTGRGMGNCTPNAGINATNENSTKIEYGQKNGNGKKLKGQNRRN